jgi:hypothetical protein
MIKTKRPTGEWVDNKFIVKCPVCGAQGKYSYYDDGYDAYYCEPCNKWIDEKCSDPECEWCSKRPERPN